MLGEVCNKMGIISRLVWKQVIKYFLIIVVFLTGFAIIRLLINVDPKIHWYIAIIGGLILIISFVLDLLSVRDIIPILKN